MSRQGTGRPGIELAGSALLRPHDDGPAGSPDVLLARRLGARTLDLEVVGVVGISEGIRRIRLTGPDLAHLAHRPGQDLMVTVARHRGRAVRRRYTIRRLDRAAAAVDLDVVMHEGGPGVRWAADARPGQHVRAIGPRGTMGVVRGAPWHLLVGDASFGPAALAIAESLPVGQAGRVVLEVGGPGEEPPLEVPSSVEVTWVRRPGPPGGGHRELADAVRGLELAPGAGHVYVGGELGLTVALVDVLRRRGLGAAQRTVRAYWRAGRRNGALGGPDRDGWPDARRVSVAGGATYHLDA